MLDYQKIVSEIRIAACGAEKPSSRLLLMQLAADAIEELLKEVQSRENDCINLTGECATYYAQIPHWISVEERLPERWKHCLLRFKNKNDSWGGIELGYLASDGKTWSDENHTITHWMPLPEPPKEVE